MIIKSLRLKKVFRDLWDNKMRTLLVLLSIAVGVFSFGSMFLTQKILLADMSSQYKAINPSTLTIGGGPFDSNSIKWIKNDENVVNATLKAINSAKLITPAKTYNIDLTTYKDMGSMEMNIIKNEGGNWPPARGEIVLERTTARLLKLNKGDKIKIEMQNGDQKELVFGGIVHDLNAIPANLFPQLSGYVSDQTLKDLGLSEDYNQIEAITISKYRTRKELLDLAETIKGKLIDRGINVLGVQVREPGKHWGEDNSKAFIAILSVVGTFSLILSGFLVINTIGAIISQQKRQIGVMKAVGASNKQVTELYISMVIVYGVLGLAVAIPISMGLGWVFLRAVDNFLNLNIVNFYLPMDILAMEAAAAVIVPVIAGLYPIISGSKLPVANALYNFSPATKGNKNIIYRIVSRIRGLSRPVLLSLRNTFQRQGRLWLTIGTLTVAGTLFMSVVNVRSSLMSELYDILKMFQFDITLYLDKEYDADTVINKIKNFDGVQIIEPRNSVSGQKIDSQGNKAEFISISGLPYNSKLVEPTMLSGRWLNESDRAALVISSPLAKENPDLKTGEEITLEINNKKYRFTIVGIASMVGDKMAFAPIDYIGVIKEKPNVTAEILLTVDNKRKENLAQTTDLLRNKLKKNGVEVVQFVTVDTIITTNEGQFNFLVAFLLAMAVMVAIVGGLGLAGTMSLNVMERTREIGVLRSIGATNGILRRMVVTEGTIIGLTSWILALPLSIPGSIGFCNVLGQAFFERPMTVTYNWWGCIIWLGVVMVIATLASVVPANNAAKLSIRETLAYE